MQTIVSVRVQAFEGAWPCLTSLGGVRLGGGATDLEVVMPHNSTIAGLSRAIDLAIRTTAPPMRLTYLLGNHPHRMSLTGVVAGPPPYHANLLPGSRLDVVIRGAVVLRQGVACNTTKVRLLLAEDEEVPYAIG